MNRQMFPRLNQLALLAMAGVASVSLQAMADEPLVVTANKRSQTLASVDGAVTVVSAEQLAAADVVKVADLEKVVPGLLIRTRGNRAYPSVSQRGMSSPNFYSPTVQLYLDGVPQDMAFITQPLVNVERVEVLRGPQGTLYGGNAYAGVINIISAGADDEAKGTLTLSAAELEQVMELSATTAKSDAGFWADVSLRRADEAGEISDIGTGRDDIDDTDSEMARLRLGYAPEEGPLSVELSLAHADLRSNEEVYVTEALLPQRQYNSTLQGPEGLLDRQVDSYALNLSYDFGAATLTSITAAQDREMDRFLSGFNYPETQDSLSQELRLSFDSGRTENLVGLYWQRQEFSRNDPGYPGFFGPSLNQVEKRTLALFGESRIALSDQFDLTAGLRWARDEAEIDFARRDLGAFSFSESASFSSLSPRLSLGWQLDDSNRFYVSASRGYKPGGFNHTVASSADGIAFEPETSINLEAGWRASLTDYDLQLEAVLYYIDTRDKHLYVGPLGRQVLRNIGDASSYGLELDSHWQASDQLALQLAARLGRTELENAVDPQTGADYSGNRLPYTPDTQLQLGLDYQFLQTWLPGDLSLQAGARYYSELFFEESNSLRQSGYTLVDASLTLAMHNGLTVRLFGDNLTDELYRTSSFMFGPADVRSTLGDGRSIGISAQLEF